jgi:hypothetical protein
MDAIIAEYEKVIPSIQELVSNIDFEPVPDSEGKIGDGSYGDVYLFDNKVHKRMEYYDEMICFDHEHSAYADLSPDDKQRLVFIYQSLCEAMTELNDWMKKLMSIKESSDDTSNQEKDQTTKKKMIKKTRIEIAIDKLQTRRNSSALVSASASSTDGSVRKLRKTLQSIYDFHHLSFEFIHRDSSNASA